MREIERKGNRGVGVGFHLPPETKHLYFSLNLNKRSSKSRGEMWGSWNLVKSLVGVRI